MHINICGFSFEGPYHDTSNLENSSGVYVILDNQQDKILDVGESENVRMRIETHDRKNCWEKNSIGAISYAVYYASELERMFVEKIIRDKCKPPCGEK